MKCACANKIFKLLRKQKGNYNRKSCYIMYIYNINEMMVANKFRKTLLKFGVYFMLLICAIMLSVIPNLTSRNKQNIEQYRNRFPTDLKYILFWNDTKKSKYGYRIKQEYEYTEGQRIFIKQNCPHINCYLTYNKNVLNSEDEFDAVVFNVEDISRTYAPGINLKRSNFQKYIFKSDESSEKYPICNSQFDDFFNWTWTYRLDSDIPNPYFNIYDENNKLVGPKKSIRWIPKMQHDNRFKHKIRTKDRAVAWIVDRCTLKTKYKHFIKELKNELRGYNYSLDLYGPCSKNKCPNGKLIKCYKMLEKRYFFHLALEDTVAEDFVSEKIVKALAHLVIPIVCGGADYTNFLPPGSYINAQLFDIKKLGAIIDYLIQNRNTYELFFDWKNHYYYTSKPKSYICDLCTILNTNTSNVKKSYTNFRQWWNSDYSDICQRNNLLNVFGHT